MLGKLKRDIKIRFPLYLYRAFEKFYLDTCSFHAATLTFYTLFALVPFLGLMFGLAQSFGFESTLDAIFKELLEGQEQVYANLHQFSTNLLAKTREEVIAGVGLVVLLWSVFKVFRVLDFVFNKIWAVRFQKNPFFRVHQFAAIMLLLPIGLVILGGVIIASMNSIISILPDISSHEFTHFLPSQTKLISFVLFTLLMGLSYWGLPVVQVPMLPALISGMAASFLFHLLQFVYVAFQSEINDFGLVYGSFASVPLFMFWVYTSWVIYLMGAELTYILESRITRDWELKLKELPLHVQRVLILEVMNTIKDQFTKGQQPLNAHEISEKLSVPLAVTRYMLDRLIVAELITQAHGPKSRLTQYVPSKPVGLLTDSYIIHEIEHRSFEGLNEKKFGSTIEKLLANFSSKFEKK